MFRDEIDQSTYDLYIGCGGCVTSADSIVVEPVSLNGYEPAVVEPFTQVTLKPHVDQSRGSLTHVSLCSQTRYSSVFPKAKRKYNASGIHPDVCDQGHFTIRLVDYMNRTDGEAIIWAPVIGLAESFTFMELFLFPVFTLRNHGSSWNEAGYSFWLILFLLAPLLVSLIRWGQRRCGWSVLESAPLEMAWEEGKKMPTILWQRENPRAGLYDLAVLVLVAWMLEGFVHLCIAAQGTDASHHGFWVGLGVVFIPNLFVLWQVLVTWQAMEYYRDEPEEGASWFGRWRHKFLVCCRSPLWAPLELLTGFSYFFLFGAGVFAAPILIMLAALMRCGEIPNRKETPKEAPKFRVTFVPVGPTEDTEALLPPLSRLAA